MHIGLPAKYVFVLVAVCVWNTGIAQDRQERFGNWMLLSESTPIARTYALDFKTYLEFFCDIDAQPQRTLLVRTVWDTDDLYYSGHFPFTHQFDTESPVSQQWMVYADVGHTVLRGESARMFVHDAKSSHIVVIKGILKELEAATFVLDGTTRAVEHVLDNCS